MSLALASLVVQVGSQLFGSIFQGRAAAQNRRFARRTADDILARGEEDATLYGRQLSQLLGAQRTILAAGQGLDVNQGTAAALREQTERIGAEDIARIRSNAAREAWGVRTQANINFRAAQNQAVASGLMVGGTLLGMGIDPWQRYLGRRREARSGATISRDLAAWS